SRLLRGKVSVRSFSAASGRIVSAQLSFSRWSSSSCSEVKNHSGLNIGSSPSMADCGATVAILEAPLVVALAGNILLPARETGLWRVGHVPGPAPPPQPTQAGGGASVEAPCLGRPVRGRAPVQRPTAFRLSRCGLAHP